MARGPESEAYDSEAMKERRRRILDEAREMIAEFGVDGLTVAALGKRAGVAKQTLYYAYGSKDEIVAAAILDYFETSEGKIDYRGAPGSLTRLIERMVAIVTRNLGIRNYIAALIAIWYGRSPVLWNALFDTASTSHRKVIAALVERDALQPWVEPDQLIESMVGQTILTTNAWLQGRIADEDLIDRQVMALMQLLAGVTREPVRSEVERIAAAVREGGAKAYLASL